MRDILMMKTARTIVDTCAGVKKGEKVVIVTDPETMDVAQVLMGVLYEREIETVTCIMKGNRLTGQEPPSAVAAALLESDVMILPVKKSIAHSYAVKNALKKGSRMLALSGTDYEQMTSDGFLADFEKEKPVCDLYAKYFTEAETIRITSKSGTDFRASVKGRNGNSMPCIARNPGEGTALPNIEANISPVEGTSEGIIVIDGSVPNFGIGLIQTPIELIVKDGAIIEIKGGVQADILRNVMKSVNDPAAYNIAQIALGLNPECKHLTGTQQNNDHGAYGKMHIGIGTSSALLGGTVKAPLHFDVHLECSTVEFDNKILVKEGVLLG